MASTQTNNILTTVATIAIGTASVIVACCALWVAVSQGQQARLHDRLSVRPQLDWRASTDERGVFSIKLINVGLGPAIVSNVQLAYQGRSLGVAGNAACDQLDRDLRRDDPSKWDRHCFTIGDGPQSTIYMRVDEEIELYRSEPRQELAQQEGVVPPVGVIAHYCSFYQDCWELSDAS